MMMTLLRSARADGHRPRVHGNGFIQLDLANGSRMHLFGHPDVPAQKTYTGIHDHRFSFQSKVLTGCLRHTEYLVGSKPRMVKTHAVYAPLPAAYASKAGQDTDLVPTGELVKLLKLPTRLYRKGKSYRFTARAVHDTRAYEPTLTIINKTGNDPSHTVRVFVELDFKPDNEFKREEHDEDKLWRLLEEAARHA